MKPLDLLRVRAMEVRVRLAELATAELTDESRTEMDTLRNEYTDLERRQAALMIADDTPSPETLDTAEGREYRDLRSNASFQRYVVAALAGRGVSQGAEAELNQYLGIPDNYFSLRMLAGDYETRAARNGEAGVDQGTWLDRVFQGTAAEHVGISFRPVSPGVVAYPVTTVGGSPVQRGRTEAVTESTYTAVITEIKPARRALHGIYSLEDDMRLPGLADSIERDMRAAMTESVDLVVFNSDTGANENVADITGLRTAGISEFTVTQAQKVAADDLLQKFLAFVDGQYAASMSDLRIVASVGSNVLWAGTVMASPVTTGRTIGQFLMESGMSWATRGGIDTNTANNDFGAYVGLGRGIEGAGIAAVWEAAQLIRDPYSGATTGEIQLTLNYLWQLGFPRTANFKRLKYVT